MTIAEEPESVKSFDIWIEGYAATGDRAQAEYLGKSSGTSFQKACEAILIKLGRKTKGLYNPELNTYWGCKFYDNEKDARKYFG